MGQPASPPRRWPRLSPGRHYSARSRAIAWVAVSGTTICERSQRHGQLASKDHG